MVKQQRKRSDWRTVPRDEFWTRVKDEQGQGVKTKEGLPVYEHQGWVQYLVALHPRGYDYRPGHEPSSAATRIHRSSQDLEWTSDFEKLIGAEKKVNTPEDYNTWRRAIEPLHLWSEVKAAIEGARRRDPLAVQVLDWMQEKGPDKGLSRTAFQMRRGIRSSSTVSDRLFKAAGLVLEELERARAT